MQWVNIILSDSDNTDDCDSDSDDDADVALPGHICELQLVHKSMWNIRENGGINSNINYDNILKSITSSDDIYYEKCLKLIDKMQSSINTSSSIMHNEPDHANNWEYVRSMAELMQVPFNQCLENIVNSIKSFPSNNQSSEVIKASLKELKRAKKKTDKNYNGN